MTTNQMKYFVTLCKTKSFTKTAELLYITQPAISRQIYALEEEIGTRLIIRDSGKKFEITAAGKAYYELFDKFLDEKEYIDFITQNYEIKNARKIKVALLTGWHLPKLMAKCREAVHERMAEYNLDLHFEFYDPAVMNRKLRKEEIDIAVAIEPTLENNPLYFKSFLCNIKSAFFVAADNPAVENGKINRNKLNGPFITYNQMDGSKINKFNYSEIINNNKVVIEEFETMESIGQRVLTSGGVALCDEWSTPYFSDLYAAEVFDNRIVPIALVYRRENGDLYEKLVDIIKDSIEK
jgi:DNA-binding transcriptional LysR family regulator